MGANHFDCRDKAVAEIITIIEASGAVTNAEGEYDVQAIADAVINVEPAPVCEADRRYAVETHDRYRVTDDADRFWTAVRDNAR